MARSKPNKRRPVSTVESSENNTQDYINDDNVTDELEERIGRIEAAQTSGFSDVYKFAFFFFMGIALTLAVYPSIARTVESGSNVEAENVPVFKDRADVNENTVNSSGVGRSYDQESDDQRINKQLDQVDKKMLNIEETNKGEKKNLERKSDQMSKGYNNGKAEASVKGKKEDVLIGEETESIVEIEDEISTEQIAGQEGEKVELFSMNSEDIMNKMEKDDANVDKIKQKNIIMKEAPPNSKLKGPSSKKSKAPKSKQKSKTIDKSSEKKDDKQSKLPDEIKNFKPTYLKSLTPKKIFADGRRIPPMELLPQKPNNSSVKVWLYEEFLSEEECDGLMRVQKKHIEEQTKDDPILCFDTIATLRKHLKNVGKTTHVTPRDFTEGTSCVNASFSSQLKEWFNGNWSYSTAFYPGESRFASVFEQRVKEATGLLPENGGKFQITSYPEGIGYKTHTDCVEKMEDKRDRVATILVYLDTVAEGGETEFPELGIWVRPRKARALVWNNMNEAGDCEPMSVHKAAKVGKGQHKFILQRWYYYQSFYSLGKRPPEPPLPTRKPNQPRVSCDEYENGSCRWYDEWNFDHMLDYQTQKYTLI